MKDTSVPSAWTHTMTAVLLLCVYSIFHFASFLSFGISVESWFFFSSRRRHTRYWRDWSSDMCSSDLHFVSVGEENEGWEPFEELVEGAPDDFASEDTSSDDGAFILYTSGTTKNPKGVLHTHGYTHAKRMQARYWLDLQEGDRLWCTSGTGWAKSIWNVFLGPWSLGSEIFFHEGGFDQAERLDLMQRYEITVLCQSPTEYRLLAKTPELENADLSRLRHAVSAGEPLNPPVIERDRKSVV